MGLYWLKYYNSRNHGVSANKALRAWADEREAKPVEIPESAFKSKRAMTDALRAVDAILEDARIMKLWENGRGEFCVSTSKVMGWGAIKIEHDVDDRVAGMFDLLHKADRVESRKIGSVIADYYEDIGMYRVAKSYRGSY